MFQGQLIKDSCIYSTCPYTAVQSQKAVSDYFTSKTGKARHWANWDTEVIMTSQLKLARLDKENNPT